jgi:hypothetical protein
MWLALAANLVSMVGNLLSILKIKKFIKKWSDLDAPSHSHRG